MHKNLEIRLKDPKIVHQNRISVYEKSPKIPTMQFNMKRWIILNLQSLHTFRHLKYLLVFIET